jgi:hypothetical protein
VIHRVASGVLIVALGGLASAARVQAQGLIDWPVRTTVRPAAVAPVPTAALWNPAAVQPRGRAELLVLDADVPTGLRVLGVAAAAALPRGITVSAVYQHMRVDDMERTTTTPNPEANGMLDVSEHLFALAGAYALRPELTLGGVVRVARMGESIGGGTDAGAGGGAVYAPALPLSPRFGAALFGSRDGAEWTLGAEVARPWSADAGSVLTFGLGANAGPGPGIAQRAVAGVVWRDFATLHAAIVGEPESNGRSWLPAFDASLRVHRYSLGFVHERLAQGFGGVNTFRLSIAF